MKDIRITTLHGTFLEVEFDYHRSRRCNKCGKKIWLARASGGRYIPIQEKELPGYDHPVYITHFAECEMNRELKKSKITHEKISFF